MVTLPQSQQEGGMVMVEALSNLKDVLGQNTYPGRGLVVGINFSTTHLVQVYFITARSANSRNRVLAAKGGKVWTEAADPTKVEDPSLIIYTAMDEVLLDGRLCLHAVSNGVQTDTMIKYALQGNGFHCALQDHTYEPDAPNYTPRIMADCCPLFHDKIHDKVVDIGIIRRLSTGEADRQLFRYTGSLLDPGIGICLTTYDGDGDPLPVFAGEPYRLPLIGGIREIAETYHKVLGGDNFVSLAVKFIDRKTGKSQVEIINRYAKV